MKFVATTSAVLSLSVFCLSACSPPQMALVGFGAYNTVKKDAALLERSYAAADYLAGQSLANVDKDTLIIPRPLTHAKNDGVQSDFGQIVIDQVASRLAQLGYNVKSTSQPNATLDDNMSDAVILGGTYLPSGYILTDGDVNISLQFKDTQSQRILGSFDYFIPKTFEISRMLDNKPAVYRVPDETQQEN